MTTLQIVEYGIILIVLVGWYLSYSAARLDRLHARVEGTVAALDAQVVRRAEATLELVNSGVLDAATAIMLADAASASLAAAEDTDTASPAFPAERENVESALSEALSMALSADAVEILRDDAGYGSELLERVQATGLRVQLARRFHNEAVTDVCRMRRKATVRLFRLAGYAELPRTVEFADELAASFRA
ncbi:MAG: hypothetical protein CSA84_06010 [Actinomycetales bacterium]|nr:MAG: hypothetical protein CSA84_06010 [Actinomycetales bacterium]